MIITFNKKANTNHIFQNCEKQEENYLHHHKKISADLELRYP